jgi:hypothetical protein
MPYAIDPPDPVDPILVDPATRAAVEEQSFDADTTPTMDDVIARFPEGKLAELTDHLNGDTDLDGATRVTLSFKGVYTACLDGYLAGRNDRSVKQTRPATAAREVVRQAREHAVPRLVGVTLDRVGEEGGLDLSDVREDLERALLREGLRTERGGPQAQIAALAERLRAPSVQAAPVSGSTLPPRPMRAPEPVIANPEIDDPVIESVWGRHWQRSCAVADESLDTDPVISGLVQLDPDPDFVHAAAHLLYLAALEEMGLIRAFEHLVERFTSGVGRFDEDRINNVLYCLHTGDEHLMPRSERLELMAAILGVALDGLSPGAPVNTEFLVLFRQLVRGLLQIREERCHCRGRFVEDLQAVKFSTLALKANIQAHMTGIAVMQIRDLRRQRRLVERVMTDPDVIEQFACGHPDGLWAAVSNLNHGDYGSIGRILALHEVAIARNRIFAWIEPVGGQNQDLDSAIAGAVTISTAESWYAGRPTGPRNELPHHHPAAELATPAEELATVMR